MSSPGGRKESVKSEGRKESIKPGGRKESIKPGGRKESVKPGGRKESIKPGGRKESIKPGGRKESIKPGGRKESIKPGGRKESVAPRASSLNFLTTIQTDELEADRPDKYVEGMKGYHDTAEAAEERRRKNLMKKAQNSSLNRPVGILAVHIKHVELTNLNPTGAFMNPDLSVYLRLCVGKQIKCSCEYEGVQTPTKIIMDELKHFIVEVSPTRSDHSNFMRLEIVAFEKAHPLKHMILAMKELHVYDIMKKLYTVETVDLYKREKFIADIDLEFCFSYGTFGYGYANQFMSRMKTPAEQVQHSMFYRADPPPSRNDVHRDVMLPRPVGHPGFIYFAKKVEIGDTAHKYKSDMSVHDWETVEEPVLLISRIRRKMHKLYTGYAEQPNRRCRLKYLRDMMQNHAAPSNVNEGIMNVSDKQKLRKRQHKTQKFQVLHDEYGEDRIAFSGEDMDTIGNIMEQAPGIMTRTRDMSHRQRPSIVQETMGQGRRRSSALHNAFSRLFSFRRSSEQQKEETELTEVSHESNAAQRTESGTEVPNSRSRRTTIAVGRSQPICVIPRVMVHPPTPVQSDESDYEST